nr:helix-turn-helix transcriptional regulator [Vallicoccus soli]
MVLLRTLLGDALRHRRQDQGRTLREVSAKARVSLGYLSEVERGQKEASSELLGAICGALDVPMSRVLRDVSDELARAEDARRPEGDARTDVTAAPAVEASAAGPTGVVPTRAVPTGAVPTAAVPTAAGQAAVRTPLGLAGLEAAGKTLGLRRAGEAGSPADALDDAGDDAGVDAGVDALGDARDDAGEPAVDGVAGDADRAGADRRDGLEAPGGAPDDATGAPERRESVDGGPHGVALRVGAAA